MFSKLYIGVEDIADVTVCTGGGSNIEFHNGVSESFDLFGDLFCKWFG